MSVTRGGFVTKVGGPQIETKSFSAVLLGVVTAIMAAFTDNAKFHRFYNKTAIWSSTTAKRITATFGGVAADIKAVQVIVIGTDSAGAPLTESLPAATVNTAGTVTSVGSFKTITSIEIPPHDGLGATTSVGVYQEGVADVIPAFTDIGVAAVHKTATITNPVQPRNITATAGGTAGDIKAIAPVVRGLNEDNEEISETLPAFTVNTAGDVVGSKAFKTITEIDLPVHDGTGATTSFGVGNKLGLGRKLTRNGVLYAYLNKVREGTAPTVVADDNEMEKNTITLNSALDGSDVEVDFINR